MQGGDELQQYTHKASTVMRLFQRETVELESVLFSPSAELKWNI